jgi:uncharacterized Zn finger protein (UPF0148 family)
VVLRTTAPKAFRTLYRSTEALIVSAGDPCRLVLSTVPSTGIVDPVTPTTGQNGTVYSVENTGIGMKIRGERECTACGARWSYYETGEIACPDCGSIRSVGVDERTEHTAGTADLDMTPVMADVDEADIRTLADRAGEHTREYLRSVGFVHAGALQRLDETYLAASELRRVGTTLGRLLQIDDCERLYFYELLRGAARGDRPAPDDVPETFWPERALAIAASTDVYVRDLRRVYEEREQAVDRALSAVTGRRKRIEALDGSVEPAEAEQLVRTLRDLHAYLRDGDETALARVQERF